MLEAARLLPAHRRLPHVTFNGLWWKLLALQPERIIACLPNLQPSSRSISADELYCPAEFCIEGYSAGSYPIPSPSPALSYMPTFSQAWSRGDA